MARELFRFLQIYFTPNSILNFIVVTCKKGKPQNYEKNTTATTITEEKPKKKKKREK